MIVYQCFQAIELFGLDMEGIYRLSGSANHINQMKSRFDNGGYPFILLTNETFANHLQQIHRRWISQTPKTSIMMSTVLPAC